MTSSVFRRFYRARLLPSLVICLPGLLLWAWYAWSAFAQVHQYRRTVKYDGPLLLETLHIALHDRLEADIRRMLMPPPPDPSSLYTYRLRVQRQEWNTLLDSLDGKERPYVSAKVEHDGKLINAEVRLRGSRHWHSQGAQKSLKVKLDKGELIHGYRIFNLVNDPTSMVIGEQLVRDLSRESEILTPASRFVRVKLNNKDLGVFHYETAADEALLRSSRRLPGSIYASELPDSAPTSALWEKTQYWTKVSSRTDSAEDRTNFADLERLLNHVTLATARDFVDFARYELDLDAFAQLDALDVAFGVDQRDFRQNHNYYFDPYRGRWEPIASQFRGFRSDPRFNLVDNPVLLRLKMTPGYTSLRDRYLHQFLTGKGAPSVVHERAIQLLRELGPELRSDPYWDAYRQLPRVDAFHRRLLRPNTLSRLGLVIESELVTYEHRHAQLVEALEQNPLFASLGPSEGPPNPAEKAPGAFWKTPVQLVIDGHAGVAVNELNVVYPQDCANPTSRLLERGVDLPLLGTATEIELGRELPLYPSVELVARLESDERRGRVRADDRPVVYELELQSSCRPLELVARGRHLATDTRVVSRRVTPKQLEPRGKRLLGPDDVPRFEPGEVAPHPSDLEQKPREPVTLGPGEVQIEGTRIFEPHQVVTIQAGTKLSMAPDASLVFLGQVRFDGERQHPIQVVPATPAPWGGIAIQGPATRGSRLRHVEISGGTRPAWRAIPYPAMVDVHHTRDILVESCRISLGGAKSDALHVAYVDGLQMHDTSFLKVKGDAIDLEYTTAELRRLRVVNAGDDALDLMGSRVRLDDSIILNAHGNGISAGEQSHVEVRNTLIANSSVGVLAKNAAHVSLSGSVLFRNVVGVETYQRTVRYAGASEVSANVLFVAESKKSAVKRRDREEDVLDQGRVLLDLPRAGVLDHVLSNVLELSDWQDLPRWIGDQREQAVR